MLNYFKILTLSFFLIKMKIKNIINIIFMDINYSIYNEDDLIRIKWNGVYTSGYTYCRGTIVELTNNGGICKGYNPFHFESIDEIITEIENDFNTCDYNKFKKITFDNFRRIVENDYSCYDTDDFFDDFMDNKIEVFFKENTNTIKNSELILYHTDFYSSLTLIFNKQNVINELHAINKIAKENNVIFDWV
jgi:F0F1-type ATP synthase gamma subunit